MAIVTRGRRNLTLGLMIVVAILSYVDRQVFTLFQDDIKHELDLTDGQLGLLTGMSFALFYTLAAFPIARLADVGDRRRIIALCVMVWSTATALCGIATGFWQMILARIGLAAGEAGAGPASSSLLTEIFPLERRTGVISIMLAANAVGISGGLALGGWLSNFFSWREVFLILGIPGIMIGLAVLLLAAEPRRGKGGHVDPPQQVPLGEVLRAIGGNVSLRWVSDRYGKANPRFNGWFAGLGLIASFPFGVAFALSPNPYVALACFVVVKFMMTLHLGPIIALCYAQVPVTMRATMSASIGMVIGLAGTGVGGTVAGYVSQAFAAGYGDRSLQPALALISCCLLVGGIAAIMAGRTARPLEEQ